MNFWRFLVIFSDFWTFLKKGKKGVKKGVKNGPFLAILGPPKKGPFLGGVLGPNLIGKSCRKMGQKRAKNPKKPCTPTRENGQKWLKTEKTEKRHWQE